MHSFHRKVRQTELKKKKEKLVEEMKKNFLTNTFDKIPNSFFPILSFNVELLCVCVLPRMFVSKCMKKFHIKENPCFTVKEKEEINIILRNIDKKSIAIEKKKRQQSECRKILEKGNE